MAEPTRLELADYVLSIIDEGQWGDFVRVPKQRMRVIFTALRAAEAEIARLKECETEWAKTVHLAYVDPDGPETWKERAAKAEVALAEMRRFAEEYPEQVGTHWVKEILSRHLTATPQTERKPGDDER